MLELSGKSVRRANWAHGQKLIAVKIPPDARISLSKYVWAFLTPENKIHVNWLPSYKDLIANDWLIVD